MTKGLKKGIASAITLITIVCSFTGNVYAYTCDGHTYSWRTYDHVANAHTYEKYCTKCGYVAESFTRPCNGNCVEFQCLNLEGIILDETR